MIALIRIDPPEIVRVYPAAPARVELPDAGQVSPAVVGWGGGGALTYEPEIIEGEATGKVVAVEGPPRFRIVEVTRAEEIPEDKVAVGAPTYSIEGGAVVESRTLADAPPPRWTVSTRTIVRRTIDAGMAAQAVALLRQHPDLEFRFLTAGEIWNDDPPTLQMLGALKLDPAIILAPEA